MKHLPESFGVAVVHEKERLARIIFLLMLCVPKACFAFITVQDNTAEQFRKASSKNPGASVQQEYSSPSQPKQRERLPEEIELQKATIANQNAQREYYISQTNKTKESPWWGRIGNIAAIFAALVAFMTLVINQQITMRNQQDSRFDEALKRFGDKSPATRASAAALLAQLGLRQRRALSWNPFRWKRNRPYHVTAVRQLLAGLQLETNHVVQTSINTSLASLLQFGSSWWFRELYLQNLGLQHELAKALAEFMVVRTGLRLPDYGPGDWDAAANLTVYDTVILKTLSERFDAGMGLAKDFRNITFQKLLDHAWERYGAEQASENKNGLVQKRLTDAAKKLEINTIVWEQALKLPTKLEGDLDEIFLARLNLFSTKLVKPSMINTQLQQATLNPQLQQMPVNAPSEQATLTIDFRGGVLHHSRFDEAEITQTKLDGVDLMHATFIKTYFKKVTLTGAHLNSSVFSNARLYQCDFTRAELIGSDWCGASFSNCKLDDAQLYEVKIDKDTRLQQTKWWMANFATSQETDAVLLDKLIATLPQDESQLKKLFGDETVTHANWWEKAHSSVRLHMKEKQGPRSAQV